MDSIESNFDSNGAPYGRGPASRKEERFSVVMVTQIALDSVDEVTRKKKAIDSRKNELRSCSTARERSRFVLERRQLAFLRVLPCISDVWRAFSPRFSRFDAQWIDLHSQKFLTSSWLCVAQPGRVCEPTAARGRCSWSRSVVRGSNAVVDREEKKDQFSLRNYPQLESLSCTSISLDSPSTLLSGWSLFLSVCRGDLSLSLSPTSARCHSSGTHSLSDSLLSSSIFFSLSFILKRIKERRAFVQSMHELQPLWIDHKLCSLKADAIDKDDPQGLHRHRETSKLSWRF